MQKLKVAIVHDWLLGYRGGERVLEAILELFPEAEIFTLFHRTGALPATIEKRPIHTSFLNRLPLVHRYYRHLLPFLPMAIEKLDLSNFDLVISSSHCVAKGILPRPDAVHVCYCHTPMRYAWDRYPDYFGGRRLEPLILPFIHYLRMWDAASSARVDHFVANSQWVSHRIQKYYRRSADVVPPFVNLENFRPKRAPRGNGYLAVAALVPYKRIEHAVIACKERKASLQVVGEGPELSRLKAVAGPETKFLGSLPTSKLAELYSSAKALLFPGEEDFGIAPLEAMASGTPVIAYGRGGARESVIDGVTGILYPEQSAEGLGRAIDTFEAGVDRFQPDKCRKRAEEFSRERFQGRFLAAIERALNPPSGATETVTRPYSRSSLSQQEPPLFS